MTDAQREAQLVLAVDDSDPRDPDAACDRCGRRGTIARATRHTAPPTVTRYCGACWPEAQAEFEAQRNAEIAEHREASRRWREEWRRDQSSAPPRPPAPPAFSSASRSWHDTRRYLERIRPDQAMEARAAEFARAAKFLRERASQMDGPMPSDVAAFVDRFDPTG